MFDISRGKKTLFFKKCPNNGLVSEKKYIGFFFTVGGGGGVRSKQEKFHGFFFLIKASLREGFKEFSHLLEGPPPLKSGNTYFLFI